MSNNFLIIYYYFIIITENMVYNNVDAYAFVIKSYCTPIITKVAPLINAQISISPFKMCYTILLLTNKQNDLNNNWVPNMHYSLSMCVCLANVTLPYHQQLMIKGLFSVVNSWL